jgi:hypothetical protein
MESAGRLLQAAEGPEQYGWRRKCQGFGNLGQERSADQPCVHSPVISSKDKGASSSSKHAAGSCGGKSGASGKKGEIRNKENKLQIRPSF